MSLNEIFTKIKDFLLPKYTEIILFLTSLVTLLVFATEPFLQKIITDFLMSNLIIAIVFLFIVLGFLFSIYYAFTDKIIVSYHKDAMLSFVVVINIFVGMSAMFYLSDRSSGLNYIFPLINYLNALILAFTFRTNILKPSAILDIHAKRSEILVGSIAVILIFIYSRYILNDYWAITFSMCLAYATIINEIINKILFKNRVNQ